MQKFNATNVVLNSIRLATPCKSGGRGEWKFAQFRKVLREKRNLSRFAKKNEQNIPVLRCSS